MLKLSTRVDQLSQRVDQLSQRVRGLSQQLSTETAAAQLSRWASRHPPQSHFLRQIAEGNTGRYQLRSCSSHAAATLGSQVDIYPVYNSLSYQCFCCIAVSMKCP